MLIPVKIIPIQKTENGQIDLDKVVIKAAMPDNFDIKSGRELSIFLKTLINSGLAKIILDMSALIQIDSSSIGVLINIAKASKMKNGDLIFINVSRDIDAVFKMMHLNKFIKFYASEEDALKALQI